MSDPRTTQDSIDPSTVRTASQLLAMLKQLRAQAGNPTLHELERRAAKSSPVGLPDSTTSEVLRGKRSPTLPFVLAFARACGVVSQNQLDAWEAAWKYVNNRQRSAEESSPRHTGGGTWYFPDQWRVVIVCARLPKDLHAKMPYADPEDPDYIRSYTYADLDALLEVYGHICRVNPASEVIIRTTDLVEEDDYSAHLVLLGGVDWNPVLRDSLHRLSLPIRQRSRSGESAHEGFFEVGQGEHRKEFAAVLDGQGGKRILREDVAHFFRGRSPYDPSRTLTICNGMFGRGTYGAVRTLTDPKKRNRNEDYLRRRFPRQRSFSILFRVLIVDKQTITPDWSIPENIFHAWSED